MSTNLKSFPFKDNRLCNIEYICLVYQTKNACKYLCITFSIGLH